MRKCFTFKISGWIFKLPKQRLCLRLLMHNYFMKITSSVYCYHKRKKKSPQVEWGKHRSAGISNTGKSLTFPDGFLILTRLKPGQMNCQSFPQQYVRSPPFPQGRIYPVIIQTCREEGWPALSVFTRPCVKYPPRALSDLKRGNAAQALEGGRQNMCAMSAAGNNLAWAQAEEHTQWCTLGKTSVTHMELLVCPWGSHSPGLC